MSFIYNMLNLKITDRCLNFLFYIFLVAGFFAIGIELKNFLRVDDKQIELKPAFTFLFWAFFAKYFYAIQYWLKKLDSINSEERSRQLSTGEIKEK
ncbi:hypothetical protein [Acinetobacter gyllenbergii]|uniref:hypothetical protein n=1 Tax=Acinetobacter gyllenbergii TaxID=134534 RepID=UPI003F551D0F